MKRLVVLLALLLLPAPAVAQVFVSELPHPEFTVAPLFVNASLDASGAPPRLTVFWSISFPPDSKRARPNNLYLLLPYSITEPGAALPGSRDLASYVEARRFTVIRQGAIPIVARNRLDMGSGRARQTIGAAPYVAFVRESAERGRSRAATLVRIPWSQHLASHDWLVGVDMFAPELVRDKPQGWYEEVFWGPRHIVSVGFGDLRHQALYPLYFELRDNVVPIGRDFSTLTVNLADANRLRVDQLTPATANRQPSESRKNTEQISVPLMGGEGIAPQVVRVTYGYYSGSFEWRPIVISLLFLIIGNVTGPVLVPLVRRLLRVLNARLHLGADPARESGVVLSQETLAKLRPGESTFDDVVKVCGTEFEEQSQRHLAGGARRTVTYRGERRVPQRGWRLGVISSVRRWDHELHEVEIELQNDRVADVQARIRRARWEPAAV
jgi:hypothetical protein